MTFSCVYFLFISCVFASSNGTCGRSLTWSLDDSGTLNISGRGEMASYFSLSSIPWYSSRDSIKEVIIEDGVTSIGSNAFSHCYHLISVTILSSVKSIGLSSFCNCGNLTTIIIPSSVKSIGDEAFSNCHSLTDILYTGTEAQWNKITFGSSNEPLINATKHYSFKLPSEDDIDDPLMLCQLSAPSNAHKWFIGGGVVGAIGLAVLSNQKRFEAPCYPWYKEICCGSCSEVCGNIRCVSFNQPCSTLCSCGQICLVCSGCWDDWVWSV